MISKHYSAKRIAQEIADAIVENFDGSGNFICVSDRISKGLAKEFNAIISPLRTEVIKLATELASEKTNAAWNLKTEVEESYPGEYELKTECWLVYTCE